MPDALVGDSGLEARRPPAFARPAWLWNSNVDAQILVCLIFASFAFRAFIISDAPMWGWDEFTYVSEARKFSVGQQAGYTLAQPLYPWLLQFSYLAFEGYRDGVQAINLALAMIGVLGVYLAARQTMDQRKALIAALLASMAGNLSITAYAMTEPLIFASYWMLLAALVACFRPSDPNNPARQLPLVGLFIAGAIFSISLAASPKLRVISIAWFALAAVFAGITIARSKVRPNLRDYVLTIACCVEGFVAMEILLRLGVYRSGADLYAYLANNVLTLPNFLDHVVSNPKVSADNIIGHVATSLAPFAVAAPATFLALRQSMLKRPQQTVLLGLGLVGIALAFAQCFFFTMAMHEHDSNLGASLLARYYMFAAPVFIAGLLLMEKPKTLPSRAVLLAGGGIILLAVWYSIYSGLSGINTFGGLENAGLWNSRFASWYAVLGLAGVAAVVLAATMWRIGKWVSILLIAAHGVFGSIAQAIDIGAMLPSPPVGCEAMHPVALQVAPSIGHIYYVRWPHERTMMRRLPTTDGGGDIAGPGDPVLEELVAAKGLLRDLSAETKQKIAVFPLLMVENFPESFPEQPGLILATPECALVRIHAAFSAGTTAAGAAVAPALAGP